MTDNPLVVNITKAFSGVKANDDEINNRLIYDLLLAKSLAGEWPTHGASLEQMRDYLRNFPVYRDHLSEILIIGSLQSIHDAPWLDSSFGERMQRFTKNRALDVITEYPGFFYCADTLEVPDFSLAESGLIAAR